MMEDFNQMCADIEDGLGKTARDAASAVKTAGAAATPASLRSGLFRAAYNHYSLLSARETMPHQMGVLCQPFARGRGGSTQGMVQLEKCAWTSGGQALTLDHIRQTFSLRSQIKDSSKTLSVSFTAPYAGVLSAIHFSGDTVNHGGDPGNCTVRLTNLNTGKVESETRNSFHFPTGSSTGTFNMQTELVLHAGKQYLLEVTMDNMNATPEMTLVKSREFFTLDNSGDASVPLTVDTGESSQGGLVLVRYDTYGPAGSVSLSWDGGSLSPRQVRSITDSQGRTLQEAEFRRSSSVPASSSLTVHLSCPSGGEIFLYEVGAVMI